MSKRRKKGVTNNTKETAGDSRFSVLTDEKDTYSPFKGLSVDDVVVKKKTPSPNNNLRGNKTPKTPQNNQPKKIVETFDNDVSFSDIFSSWENGRSLDNVKKKIQSNNSSKPKVIEEEDFASVFSQWEKSQGIAPKEKKTPPNKSKQYKPRKDFGSLLDEFEGNPNQSNKIITPNINQILKRTDVDSDESSNKAKDNNQKQQPKESTKNTELPNNYRVIAESGSNNLHKTNKIDYKDLNKGKNINTKIQTKLSNEVATKVVEAKAVEAKAVEAKAVEAKAVDAKAVDAKVVATKVVVTKVVDAKVVDAKVVEVKVVEVKPVETKIVVDKEDNVESLTDKIELEKNSKEVATTKKRDESSKTDVTWNIDTKISTKYYNDDFEEIITEETEVESTKLNSSSKNSVQSNKYKNKESKTKRAPFVLNTPPTEDVPTKWNFSDIYQAWSNSNEEDKAIAEAKKMKTKKDNKGISISYLRSMSPQDELDLHGLVSDMAFIRTREFLERSRDNGLKKVSIITGKGLHSSDGIGILRDTALSAISLSGIVREAYHPKACDGGSGAIWVIFKSTTDKKVYF